MTDNELLLEIGEEAYNDLSLKERTAIASKYAVSQSRLAGLHAFQLLWKKFQPNYRMGKTYEALSEKFIAYRQIYNWYCQTVKAGKVTATNDQLSDLKGVDKDKFASDAN